MVVSDGSGSYRSAIAQHLGHATHVLDRFHVARWFAAGMIEVRRRIQRIAPQGSRPAFKPAIFRSRYLQLTRLDHLSDDRIEALGRVLADRPELEAAWRMLQHLYGIHLAEDSDEANQALGAFIDIWSERHTPGGVRPARRNAPRVGRRDLRLPRHRPHHQRPHRRHQQPPRCPQTSRLRVPQRVELRRPSTPPHPRHGNITRPSIEGPPHFNAQNLDLAVR